MHLFSTRVQHETCGMPRQISHFTATNESYDERLDTFSDYWDDHEATARQLAAIGHVYDRPPLAALEQGSRCVSCSAFVKRETSIAVLEGPIGRRSRSGNGNHEWADCAFHRAGCIRLQVRIPLDIAAKAPGSVLNRLTTHHRLSTTADSFRGPVVSAGLQQSALVQRASLLTLPTELRLYIYNMLLPDIPKITSVIPDEEAMFRVRPRCLAEEERTSTPGTLSILCTCEAIRQEVLDLLFKQRVFRFESLPNRRPRSSSTKIMYLFLRRIGSRGRALIRNVDVQTGSREDALAFSLLASCPALKSVTLRHPHPNIMIPRAPIWYVDGIACLLSLRGMENIEFAEGQNPQCLRASSIDASAIRKELTRNRYERGGIRWLDGRWMDL